MDRKNSAPDSSDEGEKYMLCILGVLAAINAVVNILPDSCGRTISVLRKLSSRGSALVTELLGTMVNGQITFFGGVHRVPPQNRIGVACECIWDQLMPSTNTILRWSGRSRLAPLLVGLERAINHFELQHAIYDAPYLAEVRRWCTCTVMAIEQDEFDESFAAAKKEAASSSSD